MKKVFIDTSAFYGFLNNKDNLHPLCKDIMKYLHKKSFSFFTHKWIEYETLSKLKKIGIQHCKAFSELMHTLHIFSYTITDHIENSALELFWAYKDKKWSVIDCVSVFLNYHINNYYIFSSDHHFKEAGLFPLIMYDTRGNPEKTFSKLI